MFFQNKIQGFHGFPPGSTINQPFWGTPMDMETPKVRGSLFVTLGFAVSAHRHGVFQFSVLHHTWAWRWLERRGTIPCQWLCLVMEYTNGHVHGEVKF